MNTPALSIDTNPPNCATGSSLEGFVASISSVSTPSKETPSLKEASLVDDVII